MSGDGGRMAGMVAASGSVVAPHPVTVQLRILNQYSVFETRPPTWRKEEKTSTLLLARMYSQYEQQLNSLPFYIHYTVISHLIMLKSPIYYWHSNSFCPSLTLPTSSILQYHNFFCSSKPPLWIGFPWQWFSATWLIYLITNLTAISSTTIITIEKMLRLCGHWV